MIALLGSYMEILAKLDKDEQIKNITKAMLLIRNESTMYQDKHIIQQQLYQSYANKNQKY